MDSAARRVLVVEDEPVLNEVVCRYLRRDGFEVDGCHDGPSGLERALQWKPDLVIVDRMLPGLDGAELCRRLREQSTVPVIMLTARASEEDRVDGFVAGADDYVTKPFSPRELMLRVAAVLRRSVADDDRPVIEVAGLRVDTVAREVCKDGEPVSLTAREFELLVHLVRHPRRAFSREELMESVWGWTYGDTATVTVHVRRLRGKLEADPSAPQHLVTVPGGYRFDP